MSDRNEIAARTLRGQAEFFRAIDMDAAADHCEQSAMGWESQVVMTTYELGDICSCWVGRGSRHLWNPSRCPMVGPAIDDPNEDDGPDDCAHDWMLRPEHDDYVCEMCGAER